MRLLKQLSAENKYATIQNKRPKENQYYRSPTEQKYYVKNQNHRTQSPTGSQPYQIVVTQRSSSSPSGYITLITITIYALNKTGQKTSNYCVGDVKAIKKEFSTN